jgi:hypothetical protein
MKVVILILILIIFLLFISFSFATEGTVTISLNASKVWWNDTVNASGVATYSSGSPIHGNVSISLDSTIYSCPSTNAATGYWNCTFNAPLELGIYIVLVNVTNITGSSFTNTISLAVAPNYGLKPIGTINRVVYEVPMLIQDLNGKIRQAWVRIMVWKG